MVSIASSGAAAAAATAAAPAAAGPGGNINNPSSSISSLSSPSSSLMNNKRKELNTGAWDARYMEPITRLPHAAPHTPDYYLRCMLGGVLSCGITHTLVCPLDIIKCRMQVNPNKYKGLLLGFRLILKEEGLSSLKLGWLPTFLGYSMQGLFKFGLYEYFKDIYGNLLGENIYYNYKGSVWLAAAATAEFAADVALCPLEMIKVKIQTSNQQQFPSSFLAATKQMIQTRKDTKFPFGSVIPLWSRQIPYTMAKFYLFEKIVSLFYNKVSVHPKEYYSKNQQLAVTFASGYLSGVACAVVSHPADSLVSVMSKPENKGKGFGEMAKEMGYRNLFTKGLGTRVLMIGTLTGLQWWIYDTFKTAMGMGTTGGSSEKK